MTKNFLKNSDAVMDSCLAARTCPNTESYEGGGSARKIIQIQVHTPLGVTR